ncbi:MAG: DUF2279 domain-containing protein [Oceanihabitans sp.]
MKNIKCFLIICFFSLSSFAQEPIGSFLKPSDTLNKTRRNALVITEASVVGISLIGLNQLWYADYDRSKFHTLNDNEEWLQMDKLGHVFTSYQLGNVGAGLLNWSGVSKKNQLLYGATLGFSFLTAVEVLDGFSKEWGFSWGDMLANAAGTGLFVGQELLWKEQRITLKYSFHQTSYAAQRPEKLGDGLLEEILKDYNGQTYWLSFNLFAFTKKEYIPKWLNVAVGYGAHGMLTGNANTELEAIASPTKRYRQYYLSLDVDLTKIKTNSSFLKTVFNVFNIIKVPFPTLEINDKSKIKLHAFYF